MNPRAIIISSLILLLSVAGWSKPRTRTNLLHEASAKLIRNNPGQLRSASKGATLEVIEENTEYSVVGYKGGSYAIVSNDDLIPAILAYSSTPFEEATDNPGFRWWSHSIRNAVKEIVNKGEPVSNIPPDPSKYPSEVPQLLSDVWGQMEPFNNLCPLEYDAAGKLVGRCVVGCVATSATQVMHYHKYPPKGDGIHIDMQTSDAQGNPIPIKIDFADYDFDWDNMLDSYSPGNYSPEEASAVARLSYPVGVSFGMIYGVGASGTFSDSAVYALRKYLKYPDAKLMNRYEHNDDVWMETIYKELSSNHPILYSGSDPWGTIGGGGHAFVLDGYDSDGLVHVNWGWYGSNNGYYDVKLLNPRIHSFVNNQDMIINVAPPDKSESQTIKGSLTGEITKGDLLKATNLSIEGKLHELDLSAAILPDGHLPEKAFNGSHLRHIILPNSLISIGDGAFGNCRQLVEVVFPQDNPASLFTVEDNIIYSRDGKEVIAVLPYYHNTDEVMEDYSSLLTFHEGVTAIRPYAAEGCFRIQGVVIPSSVEKIGSYAFRGCSGLKSVRIKNATPPAICARAFATLDAGYTRLYVPAGSSDRYSRAGEWGRFFAFDNVYETGTNVIARTIVRKIGEDNPPLTYQIFGEYVTGEPILTCAADKNSPAGEYPIKVSMGTLTGEDITLTDGIMRVLDPAFSSVSFSDTPTHPFDVYSIDGRLVLRNTDTLSSLEKGIYIVEGRKIIIR